MDRPEQMEQQMWEFVYGLLPDDEAQAICAQVVADPDVARLYAEVKLRSELVAEASRLKAPPVPLPIPSLARDHAGSRDGGQFAAAPRAAGPVSVAAALGWAVTIAATLLVGFVGYSYFKPQSPLRPVVFQQQRQQLTEQPVHAALLAPSRLQSQPANHLAVMTRSLVGFARSTPVAYRLYGDGDRVLAESESQTDAAGILQIETPAEITDRMVRLEVQTPGDGISAPLAYTFVVQPPELITHLSLDMPLCRPGETVRFRTVTLTRYDLRVDREVAVAVEITDEDGNLLEGASHQAETENGVSHGQLKIPDDLADGIYRVVARSPTGCFAEVSHPLAVRDLVSPRFRKRLVFDRESYGPGDRVAARLTVLRAEGGVVADAPLWIEAVVDGQVLLDEGCATDQQGACEVTFTLPDRMDRGQGRLTISVEDTETDVLSERIPIQLDAFSVDFFPESGALVAGVENRVYFHASNLRGQSVHVAGRVVDDTDRFLAEIRTERDGRGMFVLTPEPDRRYRLEIDTPAQAGFSPPLPPIDPQRWVLLDGGPGVFHAESDLVVEIRSTNCSRPLAITATCRGAVVGQQIVAPEQFLRWEKEPSCGSCRVEVPIAEHAQGVIRLTVYDLSERVAVPVAERLVYRQPHRKLQIQVNGLSSHYSPGEQLEMRLDVRDETGQEQSAVLGIAVVDDLVLSAGPKPTAGLTTHFWLTGQLGDARDLEDADFYLDPQRPEAARALDLLLGTQGWRRLGAPTEGLLAAASDQQGYYASAGLGLRAVATEETATPLVVADNADQVRVLADRAVSSLLATRELDLRRTGLTVLVGGLIVTAGTLVLSLLRGPTRLRRWAPQLAAASLGVILGIFWISASIDPHGQLSWSRQAAPWRGDHPMMAQAPRSDAARVLSEKRIRDDKATAAPEAQLAATAEAGDEVLRSAPADSEAPLIDSDAAANALGFGSGPADRQAVLGDARLPARSAPHASKGVAPAEPQLPAGRGREAFADVAEQELADRPAGLRRAAGEPVPQAAEVAEAAPPAVALSEGLARESAAVELGQAATPATAPMAPAAPDSFGMGGMPGGGMGGMGAAMDPMAAGREPLASRGKTPQPDTEPADAPQRQLSRSFAAPRTVRQYLPWQFDEAIGTAKAAEADAPVRYWNPIAMADQQGQYQLSFSLPERETTYRLKVDGHGHGRIGSRQTEIVVRRATP